MCALLTVRSFRCHASLEVCALLRSDRGLVLQAFEPGHGRPRYLAKSSAREKPQLRLIAPVYAEVRSRIVGRARSSREEARSEAGTVGCRCRDGGKCATRPANGVARKGRARRDAGKRGRAATQDALKCGEVMGPGNRTTPTNRRAHRKSGSVALERVGIRSLSCPCSGSPCVYEASYGDDA